MAGSLGGKAHGVIVGCISAAGSDYNETGAMLGYFNKCREIKNRPTSNIVNAATEIANFTPRLEELAQQLYGKAPKDAVLMKPNDVECDMDSPPEQSELRELLVDLEYFERDPWAEVQAASDAHLAKYPPSVDISSAPEGAAAN